MTIISQQNGHLASEDDCDFSSTLSVSPLSGSSYYVFSVGGYYTNTAKYGAYIVNVSCGNRASLIPEIEDNIYCGEYNIKGITSYEYDINYYLFTGSHNVISDSSYNVTFASCGDSDIQDTYLYLYDLDMNLIKEYW
eukprot:287034_1